jgi:hypothetical protein
MASQTSSTDDVPPLDRDERAAVATAAAVGAARREDAVGHAEDRRDASQAGTSLFVGIVAIVIVLLSALAVYLIN